LFQRLTLLVSSERGALHPQWFIFFPAALACAALAMIDRALRSVAGALLLALGLQVLAWLAFGHQQSRFLLPAAPIGAALIGLAAAAALRALASWRRRGLVLLSAALVAMAVVSMLNFLSQNSARPNIALATGVGAINGAIAEAAAAHMSNAERRELLDSLAPAAIINIAFDAPAASSRPPTRIYLLGDATPFYFQPSVLYNTTWDAWPLAESLRRNDQSLPTAIADLRRQGVTHILVNLDEIARLHADGWADPLITPELAQRVVTEGGSVVWRWSLAGGAGVFLVEISGAQSPDSMP
jgi:hypothetical protein